MPYDGPRDLESLVEFVNTHTGRGPPNVKVYKCKVVSDISMKSIFKIKDVLRFNLTLQLFIRHIRANLLC